MRSLQSSLESHVTLLHEPLEGTIEQTLSNGTNGVGHLLTTPALGDELVTDLDLGLGQASVHISTVNTEEPSDDVTDLMFEEKKITLRYFLS